LLVLRSETRALGLLVNLPLDPMMLLPGASCSP
jgi:hypothetical protein